jgi:hypothetical protein
MTHPAQEGLSQSHAPKNDAVQEARNWISKALAALQQVCSIIFCHLFLSRSLFWFWFLLHNHPTATRASRN